MTTPQFLAYISYAAKSIWAFLVILLTNVAILWVTDRQPLPQTRDEWITFGVTTFGGAWLVYRQTNGPKPGSSTEKAAGPSSTS